MPPATDTASPYEVNDSTVHGRGVFAVQPISRGRHIGRYLGRLYRADEAEARDWNHALTHVFGLSDGSVIDGAEAGNAMRYLNHSCAPNCVAYEVSDEAGELRIEIEALRRIVSGAELTLDYGLDIGDNDPADYPCRCGARGCRGTIAAVAG